MAGRRVRREAEVRLGGYRDKEGEIQVHCMNPGCRWHNDDGTIGCNNPRALHVHHKDGRGNKDRKDHPGSSFYYFVLNHLESFLLICATCHEIKTHEAGQRQGANLHKENALIRRSKQVEGQTLRRVRETPK
jgi:hypothetical protein